MRFVVRVEGIRGYGITYGVIDPIPYNEIECTTDRLGEIVLYALKNYLTQWEDSILSIKLKASLASS